MAKRKRVPPQQIELEEGYYLTNFQKVLAFVQEVYSDILQKEEKDFLKLFKKTSENGQRLYVRLALRSKAFYRLGKLSYPEIDLHSAIEELEKNGLFEVNPLLEFPDMAEPFTIADLKVFLKECGVKGVKGKREDLLELCRDYEQELQEWITKTDTILWPLFSETVEKFKLLFFGNLDSDMAQFILEDIGVMRFEKITIDKSNRYFESREHLDSHYQWIVWHSYLWEACYEKDREAAETFFKEIKKIKLKSSPLLRRLSRSYNLMAKLYESEGELELALKHYQKSSLEPARERECRLYDKLDNPKKALKICQEILEAPGSESERYFAEFFQEKMKRKLDLPYEKRKKLPTPKEEVLPLKWDKQGRVEEQVLTYLKEQGHKGFYGENYYWTTLAALLFWEEFWSPGPGVFYHPFEQSPRDFYSGEFFQRQKTAIEKRVEYWSEHPKWEEELCELYNKKELMGCRLTNWKRTEVKNLKKLCTVVPKEDILNICQQILKDPRQYSSGLPDLFLYTKKDHYILGEVKSPNDTIQTSQKRWIDKFSEWEIPFKIYRLKS